MTTKIFRYVFAFVFTATLAVFGLLIQPDAGAQGVNPFDSGGRALGWRDERLD